MHPAPVLNLPRRSLLLIAASLTFACPMLLAQNTASPPAPTPTTTASAAPAFDVATIKPVPPDSAPTHGWAGVQYHPDSIEFAWQSLPELLYFAFGYRSARFDGQITGLPGWADSQKYDIVAKISPADIIEYQNLSQEQRQQRYEQTMHSLLVERFHLVVHRGSKQAPIYEMVVAKGGMKMEDASTDANPPLGKATDGTLKTGIRWQKDTSIVQAYSMQSWAEFLSSPQSGIGRPVLDKTGLAGTYTFSFDWSVYSARVTVRNGVAITDPADDGPSIFKALDEIGLKLQPSAASMQTIVIDHVERPTAD